MQRGRAGPGLGRGQPRRPERERSGNSAPNPCAAEVPANAFGPSAHDPALFGAAQGHVAPPFASRRHRVSKRSLSYLSPRIKRIDRARYACGSRASRLRPDLCFRQKPILRDPSVKMVDAPVGALPLMAPHKVCAFDQLAPTPRATQPGVSKRNGSDPVSFDRCASMSLSLALPICLAHWARSLSKIASDSRNMSNPCSVT